MDLREYFCCYRLLLDTTTEPIEMLYVCCLIMKFSCLKSYLLSPWPPPPRAAAPFASVILMPHPLIIRTKIICRIIMIIDDCILESLLWSKKLSTRFVGHEKGSNSIDSLERTFSRRFVCFCTESCSDESWMEYLCCCCFSVARESGTRVFLVQCVTLDKALMDETGIHGKDLLPFLLSKSLPVKDKKVRIQLREYRCSKNSDERRIKKRMRFTQCSSIPLRDDRPLFSYWWHRSRDEKNPWKSNKYTFFTQISFAWDSRSWGWSEGRWYQKLFCDPRLDDRQQISCLMISVQKLKSSKGKFFLPFFYVHRCREVGNGFLSSIRKEKSQTA